MVLRSLKELEKECGDKGLSLPSGKYGKRELVGLLRDDSLTRVEVTPGLEFMLSMESPQLAFLSNNLRSEEIKEIEESDNWVYEEKLNGIRMLIIYTPENGFEFFSRNLSVTDYLPVSYTEKIWMNGRDYRGISPSFVLDSEIMSSNSTISTVLGKRGVVTETLLAAVSALLALNAVESKRIQEDMGQPLEFRVFDCLSFDGQDLRKNPYRVRREFLSRIITTLGGVVPQFFKVSFVRSSKREYLQSIWDAKGEGCIAKRLDMPYLDKESRPRNGWIKFKRSVSGSIGDTVDGFITGFELGDKGKGFENLVGDLLVSVWLEENDQLRKHLVAKVSNIPLEQRKEITVDYGQGPELRRDMYSKVVEVDGQAISARAMRLTHPRLVRIRDDKSPDQCVMSLETLRNLIL